MCSACGVLSGAPDWMDRAGNPDGIGTTATRRAERQRLILLVNLLLAPCRAKVSDFGEKLVLRSATGKMVVVDTLNHIWVEADKLGIRPVDPLNSSYLGLIANAV